MQAVHNTLGIRKAVPMPYLTKLDVATRQLHQAIHLYLSEGDDVSIYTLVHAANQVLADIGAFHGIESNLRDNPTMPKDQRDWFLRNVFASRNFFKHADRDPESTHNFEPTLIDVSMLDTLFMYRATRETWTPETLAMYCWLSIKYPSLVEEGTELFAAFKVIRARAFPAGEQPTRLLMARVIQLLSASTTDALPLVT